MKAMLQKLSKKCEEKKACIKLQKEKIAKLTRKLKKMATPVFHKGSESEDEEKMSSHTIMLLMRCTAKESHKLKKDLAPRSMMVKWIQDLIGNALCMPHGYCNAPTVHAPLFMS